MITLINGDFRDVLPQMRQVRMIFADPPDNIGLGYSEYGDRLSERDYHDLLKSILILGAEKADIIWISYNAVYTYIMGYLIHSFLGGYPAWIAKPCVQTFTFGQHNQHDLGNNHRPLVRLTRLGSPIYPDAVRVPSWRQLNGDGRADPRGKVPSDVFDFPRVVGNSKQRRRWHPTQLNEGLYERCIRLSCKSTDTVCDIFAGTGTMARVCAVTENPCILIDTDAGYCEKIAEEHDLVASGDREWRSR